MMCHDENKQQLLEELAVMQQRVATMAKIVAEQQRDLTWLPFAKLQSASCTAELAKNDGEDIGIVSARNRAEEALRRSEERFRVMFEEAPVGMVICVGDGVITRANRALCRMSGYAEEEFVGRHVHDFTHPEDREMSAPLVEKFLSGEIHSFTVEKRLLRKNGQAAWAQATTAAARGPDGKITFVLGVVEDIDQRKRAQEALAKQHRMLKHLLQSSDHERQLIAYEIHDGLAQQLTAAIMHFQAYDHLKDKDAEKAVETYKTATAMVRQAHVETRRLIAGVRPPILDESGVREAIAQLVRDRNFKDGPRIEYCSRIAFDRLVPALENAVYRICQEALTNACHHSKSRKVRIRLLQRGNRLRLEIRDWGTGFDPKLVRQNRFGLEGIRQRARLLGGKCRIRSEPCRGTQVLVELPVLEVDKEE